MEIRKFYPFVAICVALTVAAVSWSGYIRSKESPDDLQCHECNVLLVVIDPLRYDALGSMGNARKVTPRLDAMVDRGVAFADAIASSSWTLPSAMSLLTGVYPKDHRVINKDVLGKSKNDPSKPSRLSDEAPGTVTLAEELKRAGYVTGGFAGGAALEPSYGFSRGFDVYESPGDFHDIASSSALALAFAGSHKDEKLFVLLHGFDVHGQYEPSGGLDRRFVPRSYTGGLKGTRSEQKSLREEGVFEGRIHLTPEDVSFLRALYDEKVARMDVRLGNFFDAWTSLGLTRKTIVIFTSDHGDEFYEHGRIDHGMTLFDEVIRIPLVMVIPGVSPKRITQQVRTVDIAPTLFALLGLTPSREFSAQAKGVSLLPTLMGTNQQLDALSQTSYRYAVFRDAIRGFDNRKLIHDVETGAFSVYDVKSDPGETEDLRGKAGATENDLKQRLDRLLSL